jgi:RNA polymerase sigma-70 factor (ECF subfamily)
VLRGDADAFRDVVERYSPYIYRVALFHLRSPHDAEDAVQEIFFRAFKSLSSFRLGRRFKPWLVAIALNHLRTASGRKQRRRSLEARILRETVPESSDPVELLLEKDTRDAVREAILGLPATLKNAALLYYVHDMSVADISEALGLERENVKSRLHRARARLRRILEGRATDSSHPGYSK